MKKRFVAGTMLIVVLALLISTVAGAFSLSARQNAAARQSLRDLLRLMDAQDSVSDVEGLTKAFRTAMPDNRLTILSPDGTVLADTGTPRRITTAARRCSRPWRPAGGRSPAAPPPWAIPCSTWPSAFPTAW